jgi:hypothetical protein
MMTTSADITTLVVKALTGTTDAGKNVFAPRDWPTWDGSYPVVLVSAPEEDGASLGRNAPQFTVTTTVRIEARRQLPATASDAAAASLMDGLQAMREQVKQAVINSPDLTKITQQYPFFRSRITTDPSGDEHLGQMVMDLGVEFYQGPEDFWPIPLADITEMDIHVDSINIMDPGGTYTNPPFPQAVTPAPRTQGPDGRDEGYLVINPQTIEPQEGKK